MDNTVTDQPNGKARSDVARADFDELHEQDGHPNSSAAENGDVNLDVILDVSITLSMEVGRTRLPIRSLLQLNQGSVVELDRAAGEPLDVYVNGTLVAHGEVVVVNDKFGVRLIDVVSPAERIRNLR
ncbi:flagellar motor switch protein FliN [Spectribacter hydrogenoxidans]